MKSQKCFMTKQTKTRENENRMVEKSLKKTSESKQ